MSVITILATKGDHYGYVVYDSEGDHPEGDVPRLRREIVEAACIVHRLDPTGFRKTVLIHEAA